MKIVKQACTLNCPDVCKFNIYVDGGKVVKITGEKEHPFTKGVICNKGRAHLDRLYHKDRIYTPLLKIDGEWKEISFEEAIDIMAEKLDYYKTNYSPKSVINYEQYGDGSLLKSINNIFFNFYGGSSMAVGSPCWGAGIEATQYDFGGVLSSSIDDLYNAKSIILWGKNVENTSIHLANTIREAKKMGIKIIVVDPIYTNTAKLADYFVQNKPASDGALAMAMAKIIIDNGWHDEGYIKKYTFGFKGYREYLDSLDLEYLISQTGVEKSLIEEIARLYCDRYSTILIGHGLQRYKNGGNNIRAINALGAITGQIGNPGGAVNYANSIYPPVLDTDPYRSRMYADNRYFNLSEISDFIENTGDDVPVKAIVVTTSNLLNQLPDLNRLKSVFSKIEFKVCFDIFMTDTAKLCDLFIPTTTTLESEDIIYSSMVNPHLIYNEVASEPRHKLMDEYYFFMELAKKMNLNNYPFVEKREYLSKVIKPLEKYYPQIDLEYIKNNNINIQKNIAWEDKIFRTATKRYEFYSFMAVQDGKNAIPVYKEPKFEEGKFRLLTMHIKESLSSAHFMDNNNLCEVYINDIDAKNLLLKESDIVDISSKNGSIKAAVKIDESMQRGVVNIYQGWWEKSGNPNYLIGSEMSDLGGQLTYYDTFVEIKK